MTSSSAQQLPGGNEHRAARGFSHGRMRAMEPFELPAGPVLLRPWREDDAEATLAALGDPQILLWNGSGEPTLESVTRFLRGRADWSDGDHASWAVADPATAGLLGSVSLHSIDRAQADAEIGYWTTPAARGHGVAALAVDAA